MNTTATTSFINIIADLAVSASALRDEITIDLAGSAMPIPEYEGYIELYNDLYDLICEFGIGETSPNSFLRNLYDITKLYERLGNTVYTKSMYDLLANTYVNLAEINLCKKDA